MAINYCRFCRALVPLIRVCNYRFPIYVHYTVLMLLVQHNIRSSQLTRTSIVYICAPINPPVSVVFFVAHNFIFVVLIDTFFLCQRLLHSHIHNVRVFVLYSSCLKLVQGDANFDAPYNREIAFGAS